jgi:hypothetical protein
MNRFITTIVRREKEKLHRHIKKVLTILALVFVIPSVAYAADCTGGSVSYDSGYTYHTFTTSGTLTCTSAQTADVLIVGGGGGGGSRNLNGGGGGGGGGSVVVANSKALSATSYSVTIGAAGSTGSNGGSSSFDTGVAAGGGRGSDFGTANGGSGGGGAAEAFGTGMAGSTASGGTNAYGGTIYANNGGDGQSGGYQGGGGGGAGGAGNSPTLGSGGAAVTVWGGQYGAGGSGAATGGGGAAGSGYGAGGGGQSTANVNGATGNAGIVIVRYLTQVAPTNVSVSPTSGYFPAGARTFTTVHRDTNGATDINYVHFLLNYGIDGNNTAFYGLYYRGTNACHIFNSDDAGAWASQNWSANVNSSGAQSLPWVTLNSCSASASGNDLTVTWNLTFNSWNEALNEYLYTVDNSSAVSGWSSSYGTVTVDTTTPSGTINAISTPRNTVLGTISGTASDTNLSSVALVLRKGTSGGCDGSNQDWNGSSWTTACSASVTPTGVASWSYSSTPSVGNMTDGTYRVYLNVTDAAGNISNWSPNQTIVYDVTPPTTTGAITGGTLGANGWYTTNVTYTLTPADATAGISSTVYCVDTTNTCTPSTGGTSITVSTESSTNYVRWSSTDTAGNVQTVQSSGAIKVDKTPPTAPGTMTAVWVGDHYVNTSFSASTTGSSDSGSGIRGYRLCRSLDTASGCSAWTATGEHVGISETVSGSDLPSDGTYRYYYWYAYDNAGNQSSNSTGEYIRMDATAPTHDSLTVSSSNWKTDNSTTYNMTLVSTEAGVGFGGSYGMMALINFQGANSANQRGYFSWHPSSYVWTDNQVACTGGGYGSKNSGYGAAYITLVSCSTSLNGNQRTTVFTVRPATTFGDFTNNDISFYTSDGLNNVRGWTNYDLDFKTDGTPPTTTGAITAGTLGSNGWYTTNVTYTLTPTDPTSGVASTVYCVDTANTCIPGTSGTSITVSTESATNYVRWFSTDSSGNIQTTQSSGAIKIDKTNPTTGGSITGGTLGSNGWYTTNVTYTLVPADATSGASSTVYCVDTTNSCTPSTVGTSITVSTESATNYVRWRTTDYAGLVQTTQSSGAIKIDKTVPTTGGSITAGTSGSNGWYTTNVTYTLTPADATSGASSTVYCIDTANSCTPSTVGTSITVSTESATNYVRWATTDNAGLAQTTQSSGAIKLDKTVPTSPAPTDTGTSSVSTTLTFSYTPTDATSGLSQCYAQVDVNNTDGAGLALDTTAIGTSGSYAFTFGVKGATYYFRYYCTDVAGLSASWSTWTDGIYIFADQAALLITPTSVNYGSSLTLSTTGGSGSGAVTYAVTSAGTAGCSVGASTGVVTYSSVGTCTITATKAGDLLYNAVSSGATLITVVGIAPVINSTTVTLLGIDRLTAGATITSNGGYAITARGTCWDTTPSPVANCTAEGGTGVSAFSHVRSSLAPGTLYYVRGYAVNSEGTSYSSDIATTTQNYPVVTSPVTSLVSTSTATFGATLVSNGSTTITARGTCWDYTTAPTANCVAEGGTGLGAYTQARTGLPEGTLIYLRGYTDYTDGAGITGTVYSADDSITMIEAPKTFEQVAYRFFASSTTAVPGTALSTQDTFASLTVGGEAFRMRMLIHVAAPNTLFTNGKQFKLQYAQKSGTCDTGFVGETYLDVSSTTPISFYDVATLTHGTALGQQADLVHGGDTIVNQIYVEQSPFTNSQSSVAVGQDAKFDFSLYDNGAFSNNAYCLRAVTYDGTPFTTYASIPEIRTPAQAVYVNAFRFRKDDSSEASATYASAENGTVSNTFIRGDKIRIRFTVSNQSPGPTTKMFQLEYAPSPCSVWTPVASRSDYADQAFRMEESSHVSDGANTTNIGGLSTPSNRSFAGGRIMTNRSITNQITIASNQYTEIEYAIRSTINVDSGTMYCLRVTNAGDASDFTYLVMPQITPVSNVYRPQSSGVIINVESSATTSTPTTGGSIGGGGGSGAAGTSTATTTTSTTTPSQGGGGGDVGYSVPGNQFANFNSRLLQAMQDLARTPLGAYPQAYAYAKVEKISSKTIENVFMKAFIKIDEMVSKQPRLPVKQ